MSKQDELVENISEVLQNSMDTESVDTIKEIIALCQKDDNAVLDKAMDAVDKVYTKSINQRLVIRHAVNAIEALKDKQ